MARLRLTVRPVSGMVSARVLAAGLSVCMFAVPDVLARPSGVFKIELENGTFTPGQGIHRDLTDELNADTDGRTPAVLQFNSLPTLAEHQDLIGAGVTLCCYLGSTAYLAILSKTSLESPPPQSQPDIVPLLHGAAFYDPNSRVEESLAKRHYFPWARDRRDRIAILVQAFPDLSDDQVKQEFKSMGLPDARRFGAFTWQLRVKHQTVLRLAREDFVRFIQQGPMPFTPLNADGRRITGTDDVQEFDVDAAGNPFYLGVSGNDVRIGIFDQGIDANHPDFNDRDGNSRIVVRTETYYNRLHGTLVASIAAGSGLASASDFTEAGLLYDDFSLRGHAPEAILGDYRQFNLDPDLPETLPTLSGMFHQALEGDGMDLTNHSYPQSVRAYDVVANLLDTIVRGDDPGTGAHPQVWAAGNDCQVLEVPGHVDTGYFSVVTSAKNTISVGSIDTADGQRSEYSSLGPTYDGRFKPDVVAPGCHNSVEESEIGTLTGEGIVAAWVDTEGYGQTCGTSMAAPVVSGLIALAMDRFDDVNGYLPELPSTYKAMLIHTAKDLEHRPTVAEDPEDLTVAEDLDNPDTPGTPTLYSAGPDYATGYGRVDAPGLIEAANREHNWIEPTVAETNAPQKWCVSVGLGTPELKVTLAWDDEPACAGGAWFNNRRVNDLDLSLIPPEELEDEETIFPWTRPRLLPRSDLLAEGVDPLCAAGTDPADCLEQIIRDAERGVDDRNNVEVASKRNPAPGNWTVRVNARSLPMGKPQSYSLVSSHALFDTCLNDTVCETLPWACPERHPAVPGDFVDPGQPVWVDRLCKYVLECPGCGGRGWELCEGWWIRLREVPDAAVVTVFDRQGKTITRASGPGATRYLKIDGRPPGDRFFFAFTDAEGKPYRDRVKLNVQVKPLERHGPVKTANRKFVPARGIDAAVISMLKDRRPDPVHGIAVLMDTPDADEGSALRQAGIHLKRHLGNSAYLAEFHAGARLDRFEQLLFAVIPLQPEDKVDPAIWRMVQDDDSRSRGRKRADIGVEVYFHSYVEKSRAEDVLRRHDLRMAESRGGRWNVMVSGKKIGALAAEPTVKWINPGAYRRALRLKR